MTKTYISLLRGINVSGQKKILMHDLKLLYENLGFTSVRTYIQSGNVVFDSNSKSKSEDLLKQIELKIAEEYGFNVSVFVKTSEEFKEIITMYPFANIQDLNPKKTFVTLSCPK